MALEGIPCHAIANDLWTGKDQWPRKLHGDSEIEPLKYDAACCVEKLTVHTAQSIPNPSLMNIFSKPVCIVDQTCLAVMS